MITIKRKFSHWSFNYIYKRVKLFLLERKYPEDPWLVREANLFLNEYLNKRHVCLEWGSGRSTRWFASRCGDITSVEHNDLWYKKVSNDLDDLNNVCLLIKPLTSAYVNVSERFDDSSIDMCLVDGRLRSECAASVAQKIKPGGVLVVDNIDRYIPTTLSTPCVRSDYDNAQWKEFHLKIVADWKEIFFSNGVTSTAIWIKPLDN